MSEWVHVLTLIITSKREEDAVTGQTNVFKYI